MKQKKDFAPFLSSLIAIVCGLLIGFIILLFVNPSRAVDGFGVMILDPFRNGMKEIGRILYYATPLILCGLSVGFAFKTGLFNIGGSGQYLMGAFGAVYVGVMCKSISNYESFPWWVVGLLVAVLLGAIWGSIPGILKAYFNVNEVVTSIMLNYTALYLVNMIIRGSSIYNSNSNETKNVASVANLPKLGLDKLFDRAQVNMGIVIAIGIAILLYIILEKTTFGYELKACGFNKDASKYAGINENRSIVCSMLIAGAIAGLAGGIMYLSGTGKHIEVVDIIPAEGFNGISVALLGVSNPIGIIFSGLFISYLNRGGYYLQSIFAPEIIDIIIAIIIYFAAFSLIIKKYISKIKKKREKATIVEDNKSVQERRI